MIPHTRTTPSFLRQSFRELSFPGVRPRPTRRSPRERTYRRLDVDPVRQERAERFALEDTVSEADVPGTAGNSRPRSDRHADAGDALDNRRVGFDARVGVDDPPLDDRIRADSGVLAETNVRPDNGAWSADNVLVNDGRFTNHR